MLNAQNGYRSHELAATQAAGILGTIKLAASLIETGRSVDLQGLDDLVGRLCAGVLDLPPERGRELRPMLMRIAEAIDGLRSSVVQI